jgi:hypothetical protein
MPTLGMIKGRVRSCHKKIKNAAIMQMLYMDQTQGWTAANMIGMVPIIKGIKICVTIISSEIVVSGSKKVFGIFVDTYLVKYQNNYLF